MSETKNKRRVGEGDAMSRKVNQLLGNYFAFDKTEDQECFYCDFEGKHTIEHRMVDLFTAIKTYKCSSCGQTWEFTE